MVAKKAFYNVLLCCKNMDGYVIGKDLMAYVVAFFVNTSHLYELVLLWKFNRMCHVECLPPELVYLFSRKSLINIGHSGPSVQVTFCRQLKGC